MNAADQFEAQKHTPGPWRIGKSGGVVSDAPIEGGVPGTADVDYYGGHLICETVTSANARLIAASPDLLQALEEAKIGLLWYQETYPEIVNGSDHEAMERINDALAKATGAST